MTNQEWIKSKLTGNVGIRYEKFLNTLFRPGEEICVGGLYETNLSPVAVLSESPFVSINPLRNRRADINVTAYRNFLVEMDGEAKLAAQLAVIEQMELPYSTIVWSGGKSLHFVIALEEAVDEETYRKWARTIVKSVPGADPATTNPSRFTRLAEGLRDNGHQQYLLENKGRVYKADLETYVNRYYVPEPTNYRALYVEMLGLTGVEAAHPLTKAFIAGTHPCYQGRNNTLYKCAADLANLNVSIDEAMDLLHGPATQLGLSDREASITIRSAYRRRK